MLLHFTTKNNLYFWKCPLNLWIHTHIYIFNYRYTYIYSEYLNVYIDTHTHTHKHTHTLHPSQLIAHIIHLVQIFWQGIGTSILWGFQEPLSRPRATHSSRTQFFLDYWTLCRAFSVTSWNAGFLPPSKILNKMGLVNCAYGNKSPFQHFSWHSNAFLNIIKRSFSTWIHLLQATLYFCKSKFQQVWFHFFYSILFALTKLKIPTATLCSPLIAWVGIIFYWLTV